MSKPPNASAAQSLSNVITQNESDLLAAWITEQLSAPTLRKDLMSETELRDQSRQFLSHFSSAIKSGNLSEVSSGDWAPVRNLLAEISRSRAFQGFTPAETATFVLSLRPTLLDLVQRHGKDTGDMTATVSLLIDKLGLYTFEEYQRSRDAIVQRQQQELLELSTPVVRLFEGIVAVPLIGTLDSERTQVVMESLLQRIVETGAEIAIIDITGVPTVDTVVAQHLLKTVAAARLMGADCIISGIRPQIAQTIVHLGVDLQNVATKATMADALRLALHRMGKMVISNGKPAAKSAVTQPEA